MSIIVSKIQRYLRLYRIYFSLNIKATAIYRFDMIFGIFALILKNLANVGIILIIFHNIKTIGDWNVNQILFLYGLSYTSYAIWHCFFIHTISIPHFIKQGSMDRFLLRPVHPIFQAMMTGFDEDGWGDLIFGSIILIVSIVRLQIFSAWLLLIPVVCISASLIYAALSIATSSISFWAIDSQDITMATRDFQEFSRYPLTIYPTAFKFVFSSIIPIGFTAYYPSLFFVVDQSSANIFWLIGGCLFSVLFFAACCKWWSFALRFYSSTGQ